MNGQELKLSKGEVRPETKLDFTDSYACYYELGNKKIIVFKPKTITSLNFIYPVYVINVDRNSYCVFGSMPIYDKSLFLNKKTGKILLPKLDEITIELYDDKLKYSIIKLLDYFSGKITKFCYFYSLKVFCF